MHRAQHWAVRPRAVVKVCLMSEEGGRWLKDSGVLLNAASCRQEMFLLVFIFFFKFPDSLHSILKYFHLKYIYI